MNNYRDLHFVCNTLPKPETLHALCTTIRFKENKIQNLSEDFKIFNDGRNIHFIVEQDKIENLKDNYTFKDFVDHKDVLVKLIKNTELIIPEFKVGEVVNISGGLSYAYKYFDEQRKAKEVCPLKMNGLFKKGLKEGFLDFLARETGLSFNSEINSAENIRFERLFTDERDIYNNDIHKKILLRNIISIFGELEVEDSTATASLFFRSIGKKKSYGFGNMSIEKLA